MPTGKKIEKLKEKKKIEKIDPMKLGNYPFNAIYDKINEIIDYLEVLNENRE